MDSVKNTFIFCFLIFYIQRVYSEDIDEDYFFGPKSLRTVFKAGACSDEVTEYRCHLRCGRSHICVQGVCQCLESDDEQEQLESHGSAYKQILDFDKNPMTKFIKKVNYEDEQEYPLANPPRPALRHHIAHFCPNLEVARQCIRKCMAVGKPAFCGKDHVCYCGHKTKNPMSSAKKDIEEIQKEFRDMYEKYFGPSGNKTAAKKEVILHDSSSKSSEHAGR